MIDAVLSARVKSLETQLAVLKAQISTGPTTIASRSLADLGGMLRGKTQSDETDIESVEYQFTWDDAAER